MNATEILKYIVSDILTASIISALFLVISNKRQDQAKKIDDRNMKDLKDHIDIIIDLQTEKLKNAILEKNHDVNKL